ncbi:hypothetical protein CU098_013195, partial [Rhizopus stolonifer]
MATKRDRSPNFFDDEDDLDYMIQASIEQDTEFVGLDDYINHKSSEPATTLFDLEDPFNPMEEDNPVFDTERLDYPLSPKPSSVVDAMDYMGISDNEEYKIDLTSTTKYTEKPAIDKTGIDYTQVPDT